MIHITLVNLFMMPSGLPIAAALVALMAYLSFFSPLYSAPIKKLFTK